MSQRRFHIVLDTNNVSDKFLTDKSFIIYLIETICEQIDMKILKGPIVAEGIPENPGISAFAIIDFSHIAQLRRAGQACDADRAGK